MPEFVYTGGEERQFLYPNYLVKPGDVITADENPDPYWFEPAKPAAKTRKTKEED